MKKLLLILAIAICGIANAQYTKMHDFGYPPDGSWPCGDLISDGILLYGTTELGGTSTDCCGGCGTIFKIRPDATGYLKLFDFSNTNGYYPTGSLISDGIFLYGMTQLGGTSDYGVIFKIKPDGTGYSKILDFTGTNGNQPCGSLIYDGTFLYGMTAFGGTDSMGVIFKIKPDGTGYAKLLDFAGTANGSYPYGNLISDGTYLYGMTASGGTNSHGTIFKIKPDGTGYVSLHDFNVSGIDGKAPYGSLISDGSFLYGMTGSGGTNSYGTIFKIKPDGTGYSKLLDFTGANGRLPFGSLFSDGTFLYGMTELGGTDTCGGLGCGVLFKIKPDGTGDTTLLNFSGAATGHEPNGSLISDGNSLYGMVTKGGTTDGGVIFKYGIATSIADPYLATDFNIYPIPASSYFTINTPQQSTIEILNIQGQKIIQQQLPQGKTDIDISGLAKGVYILRLNNNYKTKVTKILKE